MILRFKEIETKLKTNLDQIEEINVRLSICFDFNKYKNREGCPILVCKKLCISSIDSFLWCQSSQFFEPVKLFVNPSSETTSDSPVLFPVFFFLNLFYALIWVCLWVFLCLVCVLCLFVCVIMLV